MLVFHQSVFWMNCDRWRKFNWGMISNRWWSLRTIINRIVVTDWVQQKLMIINYYKLVCPFDWRERRMGDRLLGNRLRTRASCLLERVNRCLLLTTNTLNVFGERQWILFLSYRSFFLFPFLFNFSFAFFFYFSFCNFLHPCFYLFSTILFNFLFLYFLSSLSLYFLELNLTKILSISCFSLKFVLN